MLLTVKNYSSKNLEQVFINENLAQYDYIEYKKGISNKQFEDCKEKDFILITDFNLVKTSEQLNDLKNKIKQFNVFAIFIDNSKKYNPTTESLSDFLLQIYDDLTDNKIKVTINKCKYNSLSSFPFINPKTIKL